VTASVLAVARIPASVVTAVFEQADKLSQEEAEEPASLAFQQVTAASLTEVAGEQRDARAVHTLVSRTVRFQEKSTPDRRAVLRTTAVEALRAEIAKAAEDPRLHKQIELQVAHARQVVTIPATIDEADLVSWVARYDLERGAYASAQTLYDRELELRRHELGPEHPDTLTSMICVAETLSFQGDLVGARKLQEETLDICRRVLGPEHPDTLTLMSKLAATLSAQGDLAGARRLNERTLDIRRRVLGPEHPDTSASAWCSHLTLQDLGEQAAARIVLERDLLWLLDRDPATLGADQRPSPRVRGWGSQENSG
jgi:hypothetical protein